MAWVKVDDNFPDHPKTLVLSLAAQGLWICGLCYASRHMTDGRLPAAFLRRVGDDAAWNAAEELVAVGLWHDNGSGWDIHDYTEYQRTRDQIEAISEARSEAGRRGGLAKARQAAGNLPAKAKQTESNRLPDTDTDTDTDTEAENVVDARARASSQPAAPKPRKPATTKLTVAFEPSASTLAWAREHGWDADAFQREFEKFTGYHLAKGGRMASWDQALVNWLRKAEEFAAQKVVPIRAGGRNGAAAYDDYTSVLDDIITGGNNA